MYVLPVTLPIDQTASQPSFQFRAVKTDNGWAFQHVQTQLYLGIPHTVVPMDKPRGVTMVENPFTWMIIPYYRERVLFKYANTCSTLMMNTKH
jgi:hypothetical protein